MGILLVISGTTGAAYISPAHKLVGSVIISCLPDNFMLFQCCPLRQSLCLADFARIREFFFCMFFFPDRWVKFFFDGQFSRPGFSSSLDVMLFCWCLHTRFHLEDWLTCNCYMISNSKSMFTLVLMHCSFHICIKE